MGNPIPVITEAVQENLGAWACEDPLEFAALVEDLPKLLEALHDGLRKAIESADPEEALAREVHDSLEELASDLKKALHSAKGASEAFERCYCFWLGRN